MMAAEHDTLPIENWMESHVNSWLRSIGVNETYIQKITDEEVNGRILLNITDDFLEKKIGMKSGPALMIITEREKRIKSSKVHKKSVVLEEDSGGHKKQQSKGHHLSEARAGSSPRVSPKAETKTDCKPRPFGKEGIGFRYLKHSVLQPESGVADLISPCHEYKSFAIAANLEDRRALQAKLATEVIKFGSGCMNMRSNGTIHFGVMDSRNDSGFVHGEIIGVPVREKDVYVDALDHIERSFSNSDRELARLCIQRVEFIEVIDMNSTEKCFVVEVDILPSFSIVKQRVFSVRLPNFEQSSNKVTYTKKAIYQRVGSKTQPVEDENHFYNNVNSRDALREEAERKNKTPDVCTDLGRKLTTLVADGKKFIAEEKWYILVTNKFQTEHLSSIDFLLNLRIFCVFDFDPDSKKSGFCSEYIKHHSANLHFLQNYKILSQMSVKELESHLHLFEQASWIFCNGRTDFRGDEHPCDAMTWIKTKKTLLKEAVSLICKQILPLGTFLVIFLLTSPPELPIAHTFYEFFAEMQGHEDIISIVESEENYSMWAGYAQMSCSEKTVSTFSVAGMKMAHVNATIQHIHPSIMRASRHLPVFSKGMCLLETAKEERMSSLSILSIDQCDDAKNDTEAKKDDIEKQFYHGGKVSWQLFWLAENNLVGDIIQRETYKEISKLLSQTPKWSLDQTPVNEIKIYHHPGSGGSTIARQLLWNYRKELRCAVVKPAFSAITVAEHAVRLREYEERDPEKCLPVLLLVEDCEKEYPDDLRKELEVAMRTKKIYQGTLCFILLSCRQSSDPKKMCKESPLQNFSVTHKLSEVEKRQFKCKMIELEKQYLPEYIITFVLMSEEFASEYTVKFVKDLLKDINHSSTDTRLILYVALLNTYVQNSYLSHSHCEALLMLTMQTNKARENYNERFRRHLFESSLSEQAQLLLIHLRDEKTYIRGIRMIHHLVAKEVLKQLLGSDQQQSKVAIDLLHEDVLFENKFGKDQFHECLRNLCIRRNKISRGDKSDTSFSPLIEHVSKKESPEKAIEILKVAYKRFGEDPFLAQQLARLHYTYEKFEDAKLWVEVAEKKMPNNSFILDTKGHVYKRWFNAKRNLFGAEKVTPENAVDAISTGVKAIDCFRACEKAASLEEDKKNNLGYFSEVDVEFDLVQFILNVFPDTKKGRSECLQYLVTDYIPESVMTPWECFHSKLKHIQKNLHEALERISEDLSYYQTGVSTGDDVLNSTEIKMNNPIKWLAGKTSRYGSIFREVLLPPSNQSQFVTRMNIYSLGGGNITAIFSLLSEKKCTELEKIIDRYDAFKGKLDQMDLANYIASQVALACLSTTSSRLLTLQELQKRSQQFPKEKSKCQPNSQFLLMMLFWPEDNDSKIDKDIKYEIIMSAVDSLRQSYKIKRKDMPQKGQRVFTHFYLGSGRGLSKIVHKSKVETLTKITAVAQRRIKWLSGDVWKIPDITAALKYVQGWTEDGHVYVEGSKGRKFEILALNSDSVPDGNENVEFYLGFTMQGPVANGIRVCQMSSVQETE